MRKYLFFLGAVFCPFYINNCHHRRAVQGEESVIDPMVVAFIQREVDRQLTEKNSEIGHLKRSNKLLRQTDRRLKRFEEGCLEIYSKFDRLRDDIVDVDLGVKQLSHKFKQCRIAHLDRGQRDLSREIMFIKMRQRRNDIRLTRLEGAMLGLSNDVGYDLSRFNQCKAAIEANQRNVRRLLKLLSKAKIADKDIGKEYEFPIIHKIERALL